MNKKQIEAMVRKLATLTGIPYQTDYARHYGGYNLYYQKEKGGGHFRGQFGFDYRKNTREMYYYLLTILEKLENKEEQKMKTFKQISAQCERIATLYLKGYGTKRMLERAEDVFFKLYSAQGFVTK